MPADLPKFGPLPDDHLVPDLLAPGLRLVFCGTALGRVSAARRAYYAHPGNLFWPTLHRVGLTPDRLQPQDYPQLLGYGIGLTDLNKTDFGNDAELPVGSFDTRALRAKLDRFRPGVLAFTSKTGAAAFLGRRTGELPLGPVADLPGNTNVWVLPSPSGQARRFWDLSVWRALAEAVGAA